MSLSTAPTSHIESENERQFCISKLCQIMTFRGLEYWVWKVAIFTGKDTKRHVVLAILRDTGLEVFELLFSLWSNRLLSRGFVSDSWAVLSVLLFYHLFWFIRRG